MTQVEYLPVITALDDKKETASQFAERVSLPLIVQTLLIYQLYIFKKNYVISSEFGLDY